MNESLKEEITKVLATAQTTWTLLPLHELIDAEVENAEERIQNLEMELYDLLFAARSFNRQYVDKQHIG